MPPACGEVTLATFSQMTDFAERIIIQNDQLPSILVGNDVLLPVKIDITTNGSNNRICIRNSISTNIFTCEAYQLTLTIQAPDMSIPSAGDYTIHLLLQISLPGDYARIWTYHSAFKVVFRYKSQNRWYFFSLKLVWYPWASCDCEIYEMHYDEHNTETWTFHPQSNSTNLPTRVSKSEFICQPFYACFNTTIIAIMMIIW